MKRWALLVLVFCACGTAAVAADAVPKDVQAYMDRRAGCNYWPSEPAYSQTRKDEIAGQVRKLRCSTLDHDEAQLLARYKNQPDILKAIADAHDAMPD